MLKLKDMYVTTYESNYCKFEQNPPFIAYHAEMIEVILHLLLGVKTSLH
jgi:hypothetical protein